MDEICSKPIRLSVSYRRFLRWLEAQRVGKPWVSFINTRWYCDSPGRHYPLYARATVTRCNLGTRASKMAYLCPTSALSNQSLIDYSEAARTSYTVAQDDLASARASESLALAMYLTRPQLRSLDLRDRLIGVRDHLEYLCVGPPTPRPAFLAQTPWLTL